MFDELLGRAALGRIAALEQRDDTPPGLFHPAPFLEKLALKFEHVHIIGSVTHRTLAWTLTGLEQTADRRGIVARERDETRGRWFRLGWSSIIAVWPFAAERSVPFAASVGGLSMVHLRVVFMTRRCRRLRI